MDSKASEVVFKALPHQLQALQAKEKVIFLGAGVGAGKTATGSLWHINKAIQCPKNTIGLIAANTYSQLIDSTLRAVYKLYEKAGVTVYPKELPRAHKPFNIRLWTGSCWHEILCRSLDSYESLAGIEVGWFWADEVWATKSEAIEVLMARLRDGGMGSNLQGLLTTTLDSPDTWMYDMFVENFDESLHKVIYAPTHSNIKNLPAGYIEGLKATYSDKLFDRMVLSKWVSLEGSAIYYNFNRNIHTDANAEYDPHLPILWAWDFNIGVGKPMSSMLAHIRNGKGPDGVTRPEIHVFGELILDGVDTNEMIDEFVSSMWYQNTQHTVIVYGDASGNSRDTRSKQTDYTILSKAGFTKQRVPKANPPVRDRHNVVNTLLKAANGDVRLKIHPRCKTLLKGLEVTKLKKGSSYTEDDSVREQHVTTALGYLCCKEFTPFRGGIQKFGV